MKKFKKVVTAVSAIALCGVLSIGAAADGNASWSTSASSSNISASASSTGNGIELEVYVYGSAIHPYRGEPYDLYDSDYGEETTSVSASISPSNGWYFKSGYAWVKVNGSEVERSTV